MPYGVSAMAPDGAVSFRRKTPAGALDAAMELVGPLASPSRARNTPLSILYASALLVPVQTAAQLLVQLVDRWSHRKVTSERLLEVRSFAGHVVYQ